MTNVVVGAVIRLEAAGLTEVFAWRRWRDPQPGSAVVVLSASTDWSSTRTSAELPSLRADIYAAPSVGQANAEALALIVAGRVRQTLHRVAGGLEWWGDVRVLSSQHVGSSLAEVEGHPDWRVRTLTFEVHTG